MVISTNISDETQNKKHDEGVLDMTVGKSSKRSGVDFWDYGTVDARAARKEQRTRAAPDTLVALSLLKLCARRESLTWER